MVLRNTKGSDRVPLCSRAELVHARMKEVNAPFFALPAAS